MKYPAWGHVVYIRFWMGKAHDVSISLLYYDAFPNEHQFATTTISSAGGYHSEYDGT